MPNDGHDINGGAWNNSSSALLITDMISNFDFEDGDTLRETAKRAAENVAKLKARAKGAGVPVIYVNDSFGRRDEDFGEFVEAIAKTGRGGEIVDLIAPEPGDLHVLKPQRSGFYATPLGVTLFDLNVSNVIVTGLTTDICVLFTAHDAYMRGFHVQVPSDCAAAVEKPFHEEALRFIGRVAEADTRPSPEITFQVTQ